jgi:hypothetical protein
MKKYFLSVLLLVLLFGCADKKKTETQIVPPPITTEVVETQTQKTEFAKMEFDKIEYKFGKVSEGTMVKHTFKFRNVGNIPLVISEVAPQCGCTTTDFPKKPIAPNETGEITLELDTKNKRGEQDKNARVVANIEGGNLFLYLRGEVISDEAPGPYATPR